MRLVCSRRTVDIVILFSDQAWPIEFACCFQKPFWVDDERIKKIQYSADDMERKLLSRNSIGKTTTEDLRTRRLMKFDALINNFLSLFAAAVALRDQNEMAIFSLVWIEHIYDTGSQKSSQICQSPVLVHRKWREDDVTTAGPDDEVEKKTYWTMHISLRLVWLSPMSSSLCVSLFRFWTSNN